MGSGKSTVGAILAARWGCPFVDLDALTGEAAEIFAAEGEAGFRARESAALAIAVRGSGVISLGGGTVVSEANRAMLSGWRVFVLGAPLSTLRARIDGDRLRFDGDRSRPLYSRLEQLLIERADAYRVAGEAIDTVGGTPDDVADAVEACCATSP